MERVLELLSSESDNDFRIASQLLKSDLVSSSSEQAKHKLKTRISALLKSSGSTRAYGAVLARQALTDWSIVKSHGATWAVIMLHALDLPDRICWAPITKTLCFLFQRVHGKSDLSRDIAGSKIGDYVKRLVNTIPTTESYFAVALMLSYYPTQCRPYINKLEPILKWENNRDAARAFASLCISEKQGASVWKDKVSELMKQINASEPEYLVEARLQLLIEYLNVSPVVRATVPVHDIIDSVLDPLLGSLRSTAVLSALSFISETFCILWSAYIVRFDTLVYRAAEAIDMGKVEAIAAMRVMKQLICAGGWIPESYAKIFSRVSKQAISLLEKRYEGKNSAEGLADYVQQAVSFNYSNISEYESKIIIKFLVAVATQATGIPQSIRVKIDKLVVESGDVTDINLVTLYPGKYSILPLAIQKIPMLTGMECLIHPRLPPLGTTKLSLEANEFVENEERFSEPKTVNSESIDEIKDEESLTDTKTNTEESSHHTEADVVENEELPPIPDATKPVHKPEIITPPEKRAKRTNYVQPAYVADETSHGVRTDSKSEEKEEEKEEKEEDDEDDNDDLVIPTLTMDSD